MAERILLVEDEENIARFIELELTHEGYEVDKAADGRAGLQMAEQTQYDLLLLDIMLPGLSGMEVLRRVRRTSSVPVILVTARDAVTDKVTGLDMGADDYITKPFSIEELLARIRAALRRGEPVKPGAAIQCGDVTMDVPGRAVSVRGAFVELTNREFELLRALMENKNIVMSRDTLLERAWGYEYMGETNVVDVYVRYLRAKLDDAFGIHLIQTVRGVGYIIRD